MAKPSFVAGAKGAKKASTQDGKVRKRGAAGGKTKHAIPSETNTTTARNHPDYPKRVTSVYVANERYTPL
ncbi:hypothetical protein KIPB_003251 [Kipferlia bialata]|uniref:Uncharacterized protein n=1 Tax=Kipferlia bialata TaxID=797122 RepID=A0A9K3CU63_9EUKA|nr:hypothetical protein KIPB_003251 [Kipferlia bialata]|eukprot:g3251.t1